MEKNNTSWLEDEVNTEGDSSAMLNLFLFFLSFSHEPVIKGKEQSKML